MKGKTDSSVMLRRHLAGGVWVRFSFSRKVSLLIYKRFSDLLFSPGGSGLIRDDSAPSTEPEGSLNGLIVAQHSI